jgi:hypothetical protein
MPLSQAKPEISNLDGVRSTDEESKTSQIARSQIVAKIQCDRSRKVQYGNQDVSCGSLEIPTVAGWLGTLCKEVALS